jgi:hypothetical protein
MARNLIDAFDGFLLDAVARRLLHDACCTRPVSHHGQRSDVHCLFQENAQELAVRIRCDYLREVRI